jgi:Fic family protein
MIFLIPQLEAVDEAVLGLIHHQRQQLRHQVNQNPVRWTGALRRSALARAIQGSNSIEGYNATMADAIEIMEEGEPENMAAETLAALAGYRDAMTYILRIHDDPFSQPNEQLIRALHYMMMRHDMSKLPGQWRRGPIFVVREESGETVHEGPNVDEVPGLMAELVGQMNKADPTDSMVRASLAHLNLAMIHPFRDGNGRMARALQTLLLTKDGVLSPIFCSIEEWLGQNTRSYYKILADTGQGQWSPQNSALPWVRFCLHAHYQQAATLIRRNEELGRLFEIVSTLRKTNSFPERAETALVDASLGYRIRNSRYRAENGISDVVASRDLKRLCELNLLTAIGDKRGRYYVATERLVQIRAGLRDRAPLGNAYEMVGLDG